MKKNEQSEAYTTNTGLAIMVKRDIENKIISGEYVAGAKIPTIVELVDQYSIGKTTAQKVINTLYQDGIIVKKVGIGCFVKPFVRERLLEQHKREIEEKITDAVNEAFSLGFEEEYIIAFVENVWNTSVEKRRGRP